MQVLSKEWKIFHVSLQEESGKENKKVFGLQNTGGRHKFLERRMSTIATTSRLGKRIYHKKGREKKNSLNKEILL